MKTISLSKSSSFGFITCYACLSYAMGSHIGFLCSNTVSYYFAYWETNNKDQKQNNTIPIECTTKQNIQKNSYQLTCSLLSQVWFLVYNV